MIYLLFLPLLLVLVFGPNLWVRHVLRKYHRQLPGMPGTGGELARHLLQQYGLDQVLVETTDRGDHYDPTANVVRLSPEVHDGKSISAVAVAAHEVGHAIQFNRKEPVSFLRERYLGKAILLQRVGVLVLMLFPLVTLLVKLPQVFLLQIVIGIATMLLSVLMYVAILPEEWDASFNKALPILEQGGYLPAPYLPGARKVLKAAALTYVAAALANLLSLWRWLLLLR
jgi:Zn-dependent membrane protease YugP